MVTRITDSAIDLSCPFPPMGENRGTDGGKPGKTGENRGQTGRFCGRVAGPPFAFFVTLPMTVAAPPIAVFDGREGRTLSLGKPPLCSTRTKMSIR